MVNIDPPDEIPEHWHKDFRGLYQSCIQRKKRGFDEEAKRRNLRDNISRQKEHRELLNLCVFPFAKPDTPAGYRFIRADPLEECGEKNFDYLLYDFDGHVIFGECKANLTRQVDRILNDIDEQRKKVEDRLDYIRDNYLLGEEIQHIEYVISVFTSDAEKITKRVLSRGDDLITWAVDRYKKQISVNQTLPETLPEDSDAESLEEEFENLRRRSEHSVNSLNSALRSEESSTECFDVFPESDKVTKLRTLITASESEGRNSFVSVDDVDSILENDLFYLNKDRVMNLRETIIGDGLEIGFLEGWEEDEADYKIVSRYTHSDGLEETLKKKWCDSRIDGMIDEFRQECREMATEEVGRQSQLDDYL